MASKKKEAKKILVNAISGVPCKEQIAKNADVAEQNGYKVIVYNLGDYFTDIFGKCEYPIEDDKAITIDDYPRDLARAAAYERVLRYIERDKYDYDAIIIRAHTSFLWNGIPKDAYNQEYIAEINPDLFICYMDNALNTKATLEKRGGNWKDQYWKESQIWHWQRTEYNNTRRLAQLCRMLDGRRRRTYAVPTGQPGATLYELIFEPWRPTAYPISPMTKLAKKYIQPTLEDIEEFRKRFTCFSPWAIETGDLTESDTMEEKIRHLHTEDRDMKIYIWQVDACIANYRQIVASPGSEREIGEGLDTGKDVFLTWPSPNDSPFHARVKHIAWDTPKLLEYFDKVYLPEWYRKKGMTYVPPK